MWVRYSPACVYVQYWTMVTQTAMAHAPTQSINNDSTPPDQFKSPVLYPQHIIFARINTVMYELRAPAFTPRSRLWSTRIRSYTYQTCCVKFPLPNPLVACNETPIALCLRSQLTVILLICLFFTLNKFGHISHRVSCVQNGWCDYESVDTD